MPRQRQVDEALQRAFDGRKPSGKVRCSIEDEGRTLLLHHYEHLLLRYNLQLGEPLFQWHEKPTDKRILNAALEALAADGQRMQQQAQQGGGASAAGAAEGQGEGSAADVAAEEQVQTRFGSVTVARGHSVEEKGSVFLALAAFPTATRAAADAAVTLLQRRPELGGRTTGLPATAPRTGRSSWTTTARTGPAAPSGRRCGSRRPSAARSSSAAGAQPL